MFNYGILRVDIGAVVVEVLIVSSFQFSSSRKDQQMGPSWFFTLESRAAD